jgi:hypothetical protein
MNELIEGFRKFRKQAFGMKEATKRVTSTATRTSPPEQPALRSCRAPRGEVLAHMLAVTAMLVIASILFYGR